MPMMIHKTDNNEIILMLLLDGQPAGALSCADEEAVAVAMEQQQHGYEVFLTGITDGNRWTFALEEII